MIISLMMTHIQLSLDPLHEQLVEQGLMIRTKKLTQQ